MAIILAGVLLASSHAANRSSDAADDGSPAGAWTEKSCPEPDPCVPRRFHTATELLDGRVLVVGGALQSGIRLSSAQLYDDREPAGWTSAGATNGPHGPGHSATLLRDGRVLVVGGAGGAKSADIYDPDDIDENPWSPAKPPLVIGQDNDAGLVAHTATLLDDPDRCGTASSPAWCGRVMVAGAQQRRSQLYNPDDPKTVHDEEQWLPGPLMNEARGGYPTVPTATALGNGKVLVVGGNRETGCMDARRKVLQVNSQVPTTASTSSTTAARPPCNDGRTAEVYDPDTNTWKPTNDLDHPTTSETGADLTPNHRATLLLGGKVLVTGGETLKDDLEVSQASRKAQLYDPDSDSWTTVADMKERGRGFSTTLLADGRVLVAGDGRGGEVAESTEIYDPVTDAWVRAAPLTTGRGEHTATRLRNGRVLVAAGHWKAGGDEQTLSSYEIFGGGSPRPSITALEPASGPRTGGTRVRISGSGFAAGARVFFGTAPALSAIVHDDRSISAVAPPHPLGDVEVDMMVVTTTPSPTPAHGPQRYRYLPPRGGWVTASDPEQRRRSHTATSLDDGQVLLAGGATDPTTELYDPATASWRRAGDLHHGPRHGHTATKLRDGRVLVAGGRAGQGSSEPGLRSAEVFDPRTGTWAPTANEMTLGRREHTATLLPDGKVLVAGGTTSVLGNPVPVLSVEVFDPRANSWGTSTGRLNRARAGHTATLVGHRVLFVGGRDEKNTLTASVELYDPASGGSTDLAPLAHARAGHTASLLPGKSLVVAGGIGENYLFVRETELLGTEQLAQAQWHPAGSLSHGRSDHTASVSPSGAILIAGGLEPTDGPARSSTEVYEPAAGWKPGFRLLSPRSAHTATVLEGAACGQPDAANPCGAVLLAGGTEGHPSVEVLGEAIEQAPTIASLAPRGGPTFGGTRITITGFGLFGRNVEVRLGAAVVPPRDVILVSEDTIVLDAPPHPQGDFLVSLAVDGVTATNASGARFAYGSGAWNGVGCTSRAMATATTLVDGTVLIVGGAEDIQIGGDRMDLVERYDPATGQCTTVAPMATARAYHTAVRLGDGSVLVVGGQDKHGRAIRSAERYDPASHSWTAAGELSDARFSHTATVLVGGRVLVTGGAEEEEIRADPLNTAEIFDPVARTWKTVASMAVDRVNHAATLLPDGTVLVAGGLTPNDGIAGAPPSEGPRRTVCEPPDALSLTGTLNQIHPRTCLTGADVLASAATYDPAADRWSPVPAMAVGRYAHSATRLDGPGCQSATPPPWCGQVLVAGGGNGGGSVRSAEIYDPVLRTWRATDQLDDPRGGHTAGSLPDGRVLLAGSGASYPGDTQEGPLSTAEVYDPGTERWSVTSDMIRPRAGHATAILPEGDVLVAGGFASPAPRIGTGAAVPLSRDPAVEVYTPAPVVTAVTPRAVPAGGPATVTVSGHGLARATSAAVDGVAVDPPALTHRSATEASVVVPARGPGHAWVALAGPGGTSAMAPPHPAARITYLGAPAPIEGLSATPGAGGEVVLRFVPTLASHGRPDLGFATDYEVRQIDAGEPDGRLLCAGLCRNLGPQTDGLIHVRVTDLVPATYRYTVRAVNAAGVAGPGSEPVSATVTGAGVCATAATTDAGRIAYPAGIYSLVGLPADTVVGADSPLYGWFDLGAGGAYTAQAGATPVEAGRGYWAWFACPHVVEPTGPGTSLVRMNLGGYHASMVGNPSAEGPATVTGHDFAARWDPSAGGGAGGYHVSGYRSPEVLGVGEGAWVFAFDGTVVDIAAR